MLIGNISYSNKLSSLKWSNFKKYWNENERDRTGLTAEKAAVKFGITVPSKKLNKGGV